MKRKLKVFLALFFIGIGVVMAQTEQEVQGTVVDEQGEPVIGASILVKGTTNVGTITDINGKFTILAPSGGKLIVSYVGMETLEVAVSPKIRIILTTNSEMLEEVIVTGYGSFKKSSFTGSAAVVNAEKMKDVPATNLSDRLAGNVAGVQINSNSGQPGAVESIRIRGMGSINAGNEPLYVIDGVPMLSGDVAGFTYSNAGTSLLATLNSNDIESITVIKDAAAASLYGSRAANGVVVITTKKGKAGKTKFSLKSNWGFSDMAIDYRPVLDGPSRRELLYLGLQNYSLYTNGSTPEQAKKYADDQIDQYAKEPWSGWTNWRDLLFRKGKYQNYDISAQGGNDNTKFYSSFSYTKQDGINYNSDFDRLTGNVSISHQTGRLSLDLSTLFSYTDQNSVSEGLSFSSPIMAVAMSVSPSSYPYNKDGSLATYFPSLGSWTNPMRAFEYTWNKNKLTRSFNTLSATYKVLEALKIKEVVSFDFNQNASSTWWDPNSNDGRTSKGTYQKYMINRSKLNTQTQLTYDQVFDGKHYVNALLGYETESYKRERTYVNGSKYPLLKIPKYEVENAATTRGSSDIGEYRLLSYLGRIDYNYNHKYYLSGSFRRDGSSRLAPQNRWGNFWSVSGSWRISGEEFMQPLQNVLSQAKIRASYGVNGTQPWNFYDYMPLYTFGWNYDNQVGMMEKTLGNENLKWEKNNALNIGLDLTFFSRFSVILEWYSRKTEDLLLERPISGTIGIINNDGDARELVNIGSMRNSGLEMELRSTNVQKEDFSWMTTFTLAHNKNKLLQLNEEKGQIIDDRAIHRVGEPYHSFYAYEYAGVDPATGKEQYYVNDGTDKARETTTEAAKANKVIIGNADAKFQGGLTNTLSWKFIDLSFTFTYSLGGHVYDEARWIQTNGGSFHYNGNIPSYYKIEDTWKKPGDNAKLPMFAYGNKSEPSSRWLLSTDHLRLKNMTLGFMVPQNIVKKTGLEKARIYMSGNNLLTFKSKDLYVDPENIATGLVYFRTPNMRTVTFGIELGF